MYQGYPGRQHKKLYSAVMHWCTKTSCTKKNEKRVRHGCIFTPVLFTLFMAIVENVSKRQRYDGWKQKNYDHVYGDDLVLIAIKQELKDMSTRLAKCINKNKLLLNVQKLNALVFSKGRRKVVQQWKDKDIEEVLELTISV